MVFFIGVGVEVVGGLVLGVFRVGGGFWCCGCWYFGNVVWVIICGFGVDCWGVGEGGKVFFLWMINL